MRPVAGRQEASLRAVPPGGGSERRQRREGEVRSLRRTQTAPERRRGDRPSSRPATTQGSEESSTSGASSAGAGPPQGSESASGAGGRRFAAGDRSPPRRHHSRGERGDRCGPASGHSIASSPTLDRALNRFGPSATVLWVELGGTHLAASVAFVAALGNRCHRQSGRQSVPRRQSVPPTLKNNHRSFRLTVP